MIPYAPLPYVYDALEPYLSEATLRAHHDGHLRGYVETANRFLMQLGEPEANAVEAVQLAIQIGHEELYNAAAQVVNHDFYFAGMGPGGGGPPSDPSLNNAIDAVFEGWAPFCEAWVEAAKSVFGSGWVWLLFDDQGPAIVTTDDAVIPPGHPVALMDVWEHAYYLDYEYRRDEYARAWLEHLVRL